MERLIQEMEDEEKEISHEKSDVDIESDVLKNGHKVSSSGGDNSEEEAAIHRKQDKGRGKKAKRKGKAKPAVKLDSESEGEHETVADLLNRVSDDSDFESNKKAKRGKGKNKKKAGQSTKVEKNPVAEPAVVEQGVPDKEPILQIEPEVVNSVNKALSDEIVVQKSVKIEQEEDQTLGSQELLHCAKCKAKFPSKNKLFSHLKSTGHAVYLGEKEAEVSQTTKKGKRKPKK
jgi:DnaJ family protein A protein 5